MPHKCDRPKQAKRKRAFFRCARGQGKGKDVIDVKKTLEGMKMLNVRPTRSFLMRHGMLARRPRLQQASGALSAA